MGLGFSGSFMTGPIVFFTLGTICTTLWAVIVPGPGAGAIFMGELLLLLTTVVLLIGGGTSEMVIGAGFGAIGFGCIPSFTMTTFTGDVVPKQQKLEDNQNIKFSNNTCNIFVIN